MGRPYASELGELDATYNWSMRSPIEPLVDSIRRLSNLHALTIGSGGSLTAAHFASFLHSRYTGRVAQAITPYELASMDRTLDDTAVLFCSAGGRNPDVISAAQSAIKRVPTELVAITTRSGSPLEANLVKSVWPSCHAIAPPTKKDGFLATNSLLSTIIILIRAYEEVAAVQSSLPDTLDELLHTGVTREHFLSKLREETEHVLGRSTLVTLYGITTKPAAVDIESRFTEAALAAIQLADYRNFAHGRHNWLARHAADTGVLALSVKQDEIATRTLSLLPETIPRWQLSVEPGPRGAVAAVCYSILLAFVAGEVRGIDPGRPRVASFGRKLYRLRAMPSPMKNSKQAQIRMDLAIERKARLPIPTLMARGKLDTWRNCYLQFVERLAAARIQGIVVDYDGTLCSPASRLSGPSSDMANSLNAILDTGITVAVATGRGKSVHDALSKVIRSKGRRSKLIIGYHNGAEIAKLSAKAISSTKSALVSDLITVAEAMRISSVLKEHAIFDAKGSQIAIDLLPSGCAKAVLAETSRLVRRHAANSDVAVVTSSHSIDVIAGGVSKLNVVNYLVDQLGLADRGRDSILCIGDRGRTPGNDADMLSHPLSLSVDEVSDDPTTCWTLSAPGRRYDIACLEYLSKLRSTPKGLRFDVKGVRL